MRADELIKNYTMENHVEHGLYIEKHYEAAGEGRPASGSIYYYVAPGEHTDFHRIDCDEYWDYNAGATIELWVIDNSGKLQIRRCGAEKGAEPSVYFASGEIFASRLPENASDGCFLTCVTVPRFSYSGFEMFTKEQMINDYPETADFWN